MGNLYLRSLSSKEVKFKKEAKMKSRYNFYRIFAMLILVTMIISIIPMPLSVSASSQRIEAEEGIMTGTVRTERIIGGSGKTVSFIDNGPENSLTIQFTPQTGSNFDMKLRYRSSEIRNLIYKINDEPARKITGFNSGGWLSFSDMILPVRLKEGETNTIKFYAFNQENGPGIDYIEFTKVNLPSLEKDGYRLIFNDEFNGDTLDTDLWVPDYLSSWTTTPDLAQPTYNMENGLMRLKINADTEPWCPEFDGKTVVSGFTTGNRNGLHNWNKSNIVRNPKDMQLTHINQSTDGMTQMHQMGVAIPM